MGKDEMGVGEMGVDEMGSRRSGMTPHIPSGDWVFMWVTYLANIIAVVV